MKKIISIFLAICLMAAMIPAASADFSDVTDSNVELAVNVLEGMGIVSGFNDGTYKPDSNITRAQFCKLAITAMGLEDSIASTSHTAMFADVKVGEWYTGYVNLAAEKEVVNGYGNGYFGPDDNITYGQAVTILIRILGYTSTQVGSIWPKDYTDFASDIGLADELSCGMYQKLTRGQAAILLYNFLRTDNSDGKAFYTTLDDIDYYDDAIVISNNAESDTGVKNCAQAYMTSDGSVEYFEQSVTLSPSFVGKEGVMLVSDDELIGFIPDEDSDTYSLKKGILVSNDAESAAGISHCAEVYTSGGVEYYSQAEKVDSTGYDGVLIVNSRGKAKYFAATGDKYNLVSDALLLSVDNGDMQADVYTDGSVDTCILSNELKKSDAGSKGTLIEDSSYGDVVAFAPDSTEKYVDVTISSKTSTSVTNKSGTTYKIPSTAKVIMNGEVYTWNEKWSSVSSVRLYYSSGSVYLIYVPTGSSDEAAVALTSSAYSELIRKLDVDSSCAIYKDGQPAESSDIAKYDTAYYNDTLGAVMVSDYKVTGYIENVTPNMTNAETVTIFGTTYDVLECAQESLSAFSVGNQVTALLTDDYKVAAVYSAATVKADMVGLAAKDGKSAEMISGVEVSADSISSTTGRSQYGSIVIASESSSGVITMNAVSSSVPGNLNISTEKIGTYELAPNIKAYEWAGSGYAVEISLDDITWTNVVASTYIDYIHINSAGKVDMILFNSLTGDCYEYGYAVFTTSGSSKVLSVENSNTSHISGVSGVTFGSGTSIGIAGRGDGQLAGTVVLTGVSGITTSDFESDELVIVRNYEMEISDEVQVYNEKTESWTSSTLADAISFGGTYTVYYDRTPTTGGKIRIVVLNK